MLSSFTKTVTLPTFILQLLGTPVMSDTKQKHIDLFHHEIYLAHLDSQVVWCGIKTLFMIRLFHLACPDPKVAWSICDVKRDMKGYTALLDHDLSHPPSHCMVYLDKLIGNTFNQHRPHNLICFSKQKPIRSDLQIIKKKERKVLSGREREHKFNPSKRAITSCHV